MKISDILNNIDNESLALPVFQRGYVWKRKQVKDLMHSLYQDFPVGSLLTWTTSADRVEVRGPGERTSGAIDLLLDGQQRVTSLYGLVRGKPPAFFDGDPGAFSGLYFNLENEDFEFLPPTRANADPLWISVTELFGADNHWIGHITGDPEYSARLNDYLQRGLRVGQIGNVEMPIQQITGDDKTTDVVVDIFNRVNSGGTKLSKGDLALARIGARWPSVRAEMQQRLVKWQGADFNANLDWLLRCMNAIITGGSEFERLETAHIDIDVLKNALRQTENAVDHLLEAMRSHLYMDIDRVYSSKAAFPVMVKYLVDNGGKFQSQASVARLLHWYVSVAIWGRFSGPTETIINQDLAALGEQDPIDTLLRNLRLSQGERTITHENFNLSYTNARFYPLLYMMSRTAGARDWCTGIRLRHHSLGNHTNLELHHIFPKAYLGRNGVAAKDANNMGNIAFLTKECNLSIGSKAPAEYLPIVASEWPGALEAQWIPMDPELWKIENYRKFLDARRQLLAEGANDLLTTLRQGLIPPAGESGMLEPAQPTVSATPAVDDDLDNEELIISDANRFAMEHGLPAGERAYEIHDEENGELAAVLDLAWPNGLQIGYTQPVALLVDEDDATRQAARDADFKVFSSLAQFRRYVQRDILAEAV